MKTRLLSTIIAALGLLLVVSGGSSHQPQTTTNPETPASPVRVRAGEWLIETVDSGSETELCPSLALDSSNHPHLSYIYSASSNSYLKYAYYNGSLWQTEVVDDLHASCNTSLALDGLGRPHIGYMSGQTPSALEYAHYDGTIWHTETIDPVSCTLGLSLALDTAGRPHISYTDCADNRLKYAYYDDVSWQILIVESMPQGVIGNTSLALNASGNPRIAYCSYDVYYNRCDYLKYAWYDGTAWFSETVASFGGFGGDVDLVLDGLDRPHISYEGPQACLSYAYLGDAGWITMTVDCGAWNTGTSLALNAQGRPCTSYVASYSSPYFNSFLKYACDDGTMWQVEFVDPQLDAILRPTSLALDYFNQPHIGFYDTAGNLGYAHKLSHYLYYLYLPSMRNEQ